MSVGTQFGEVFKEEHRAIRNALLNLIQAFRIRDFFGVRHFLNQASELSGPHFRYEAKSLYPGLLAVLDEEQVRKLFGDQECAIEAARNLLRLAAQSELTGEDAQVGARCARSLLPHVFECDGLSIMAELLPEQTMQQVLKARDRSRQANLDLLRWAETVRHAAG